MRISCPSCGASFNVKPEALGSSGRKVKCGKCAHQWLALPDGTAAEAADASTAPARPPAPPPEPEAPVIAEPAEPADKAQDLPAVVAAGRIPAAEPPAPEPPAEGEAPATMEPAEPAEPAEDPQHVPTAIAAEGIAADGPLAPEPPTDLTPRAESEESPFPKLSIPDTTDEDPADEFPAPEPPADMPAPEAAATATSAGRRWARRAAVSMLATAAAAVILVGGAVFLQPQITGLVPAAASLYAKVGLQTDIPGLGLKIVEPQPRKLIEGDDEILEVVGVIRNETKGSLDIPVMQARLLDGAGEPLNVWRFRAAKAKIAPGESVEYKTEFRNPPKKAERLDITFTRQEPAPGERPELARKPAPDAPKTPETPKPDK